MSGHSEHIARWGAQTVRAKCECKGILFLKGTDGRFLGKGTDDRLIAFHKSVVWRLGFDL